MFAGQLFPFLFITIACGAVSGFHALVSSGTTPKMIANERTCALIGYGGMLMEAFVAVMALIAACVLQPGVYFAMNAPPALIGTTVDRAAAAIATWGFVVTPDVLTATAQQIGEHTILSRTGGAPTLAVGMAQILNDLVGGSGMMAFWYHYAILFEALFILTTLDAGTRVAPVHDPGPGRRRLRAVPAHRELDGERRRARRIAVGGWGWFLYQGVIDPLGGINTLWPLFGIANQMLAGIALTFCCVVMVKMKRERYLWIPLLPTALAPGLHADRGLAEAVPSGPEDRLPRERRAVRRRGRARRSAGARDVARGDAARRVQQHARRGLVRVVHRRCCWRRCASE